jgi:hypothetical protein
LLVGHEEPASFCGSELRQFWDEWGQTFHPLFASAAEVIDEAQTLGAAADDDKK